MLINWKKLSAAHKDLVTAIDANTDVVFLLVLGDGKVKKHVIKFKDFMQCFWVISETKGLKINMLVVQDREGRVLYRHKQHTKGNEEIPVGGHENVVKNWKNLSNEEKEIYLKLLCAQCKS